MPFAAGEKSWFRAFQPLSEACAKSAETTGKPDGIPLLKLKKQWNEDFFILTIPL